MSVAMFAMYVTPHRTKPAQAIELRFSADLTFASAPVLLVMLNDEHAESAPLRAMLAISSESLVSLPVPLSVLFCFACAAQIESAYYPLQASKDVCFELGRLLMGLKDYASAVEFFKRSNEACGEHHVTWHNMGICYYYIDSLSNSIKCFRHSLDLKADYKEARDWLAKVSGKAQRPPVSEDEYTTDSDEEDEDEEE